MGVAERKERERERRRQDILDAAETVFFSKGLHQATMDEVAEAAELSKGTLYLYFKSKEELFYGINCRGAEILKTMFDEAFEKNETGRDKLLAIGRAYIRFAKEHTDYFNAMMHHHSHAAEGVDSESMHNSCPAEDKNVIKVVADAVRIGQKDGTITSDGDPLRLAFLLWGQTTGVIEVITHEKVHLDAMDLDCDTLIEDHFQFAARGLQSR